MIHLATNLQVLRAIMKWPQDIAAMQVGTKRSNYAGCGMKPYRPLRVRWAIMGAWCGYWAGVASKQAGVEGTGGIIMLGRGLVAYGIAALVALSFGGLVNLVRRAIYLIRAGRRAERSQQ